MNIRLRFKNPDNPIVYVMGRDLAPHPQNWRTHPPEQLDALRGVFAEVGICDAVKGFELPDGRIQLIDGHARAEILPDQEVPVLLLDVSPEEAKKLLTVFDPLGDIAGADSDKLAGLLAELETDSPALLQLCEELAEKHITEAASEPKKTELLGDPDEVPEPPVEPVTKPGDLWILGEHRLLCGDSTKAEDVARLMNGNRATMMFSDPPYGYSYESNRYKGSNPFGELKNDDKILDYFEACGAVLTEDAAVYVCTSHQVAHMWRAMVDAYFQYKNLIVWKKNNWSMGDLKGAYAGQHELIIFAHKGRIELNGERSRDVWEFRRDPPENHPTQKPVELIAFALQKTSAPRDAILDPFLGSGTTLIAAEQLGRKCYGMEISPAYCDVIVKRWETLTGKKAVLDKGGA